MVLFLEFLDHFRQPLLALTRLEPLPNHLLVNRLERGQILFLHAEREKMFEVFRRVHGRNTSNIFSRSARRKRCSRYSVAFTAGVREPEHSRITSMYFDGNSFII